VRLEQYLINNIILTTFGLGLGSVCSRWTSSQEETDQSVCRLQDIT